MAITSARLARLERQQEFLRKRGRDMLRRGLQTLDELDAAEEKEQQVPSSSTGPSPPPVFPEFDVFGGLSQSFWELPPPGASVGTPPTTQGS